MILDKQQKNTQTKLMLVLSAVCGLGILPFVFYRATQNDWFMVSLDLFIVVGMSMVFIYVYKTHNTKYPSFGFVIIALVGSAISFYLNGGNVINWIYPAMLSTFFVVKPKLALLINTIDLLIYVPKMISIFAVSDNAIILISVTISNIIAFSFAQGLRSQEKELKKLAVEDCLTLTGNRRALDIELDKVHGLLKNPAKTASLIILDIDYFKIINDSYGHIKGDEVLVALSQLLKEFFKENNYSLFRYGGEEFVVVCFGMKETNVYKLANVFRELVRENIHVSDNTITISLGVAEYIKGESVEDWMQRVDKALYAAKNQGRDKVMQLKMT